MGIWSFLVGPKAAALREEAKNSDSSKDPEIVVERPQEAKRERFNIELAAFPDLRFEGYLIGTATWQHKSRRSYNGEHPIDTARMALYAIQDKDTPHPSYLGVFQWRDITEAHVGESAAELFFKLVDRQAQKVIKMLLPSSLNLNDGDVFASVAKITTTLR